MIIIIITLKNAHNLFIIIIQIQLQSKSFYSIPNKTQMGNPTWRLQNQFLVVILLLSWPFSSSTNRTHQEIDSKENSRYGSVFSFVYVVVVSSKSKLKSKSKSFSSPLSSPSSWMDSPSSLPFLPREKVLFLVFSKECFQEKEQGKSNSW